MHNKPENTATGYARQRGQLKILLTILSMAALVRLVGITWGLPNQYHVTTYSTDEYSLLTLLQGINPAKSDFNPASEAIPLALASGTFHLYSYAATLKALSLAGWIPLTRDKEFYYRNIHEWDKFFLTGRFQSFLYGLLTVWLIYLLAEKMYGPRAALFSALFLACMPAHVIHSRYMLANGPGVFWIVLTFYFLKNIIDTGKTRDYFLAGMSAGLAIAMRFSAGPLIPMLFLAHAMANKPSKNVKKLAIGLCSIFLFFIAVTPHAILDYHNFLKSLAIIGDVAVGGTEKFILSKNLIAAYANSAEALGLSLLILCLAGISVALARRKRDDILLLFWILPMLLIFINAGVLAIPGRILPVLPFMAILGARALSLAWESKPAAAKIALTAILAHFALFYTASFKLLLAQDIRDTASGWMIANIKPGASIGLVTEPSWYNPGIIDRKYRHPDHHQLPDYKFVPLLGGEFKGHFGYDRLGAVKPDFAVVSSVELNLLPDSGFLKALNAYGYREVHKFEHTFSVFGFKLARNIPPMLFIPDSISVFKRIAEPGH